MELPGRETAHRLNRHGGEYESAERIVGKSDTEVRPLSLAALFRFCH
jgi:hypothetical protein